MLKKEQFECKQHNRTFKSKTALLGHLRSPKWHAGTSAAPVNGAAIASATERAESIHLAAALDVIDTEIGRRHGELQTLKVRREHIAQALAS